jgi:hypothetical protein
MKRLVGLQLQGQCIYKMAAFGRQSIPTAIRVLVAASWSLSDLGLEVDLHLATIFLSRMPSVTDIMAEKNANTTSEMMFQTRRSECE